MLKALASIKRDKWVYLMQSCKLIILLFILPLGNQSLLHFNVFLVLLLLFFQIDPVELMY